VLLRRCIPGGVALFLLAAEAEMLLAVAFLAGVACDGRRVCLGKIVTMRRGNA
jgi:hypothetical protein